MAGNAAAPRQRLTPDQRNSFIAAQLGWTMDAFDYFIVVLVYADIAKDLRISLTTGGVPDHGHAAHAAGRRAHLRAVGRPGRSARAADVDVCFYSVVGFLCAFAPNFTVLVVLRLLYGIGMGGEWGLGAALAMEKIPTERRGFFSGLLQEGYSFGYLLAVAGVPAGQHRVARPVLAVAVRAEHHPGADHAC